MDTGRPDGASSSPNDNRISKIRREGAGGEVARVDLSDGSSFFVSFELVESEGFAVGTNLSDEQMERLALAAEQRAAVGKALDLLALNEQPRARLALKLSSRGFGDDAVRRALDDLTATGALDDLRFARLWVASRTRRNPCGRALLYAQLLKQGVRRRTAEEALRDWDDEDEGEALQRAAARAAVRRGTDPDKVRRTLLRKGFSLRAVNRHLEGTESDF